MADKTVDTPVAQDAETGDVPQVVTLAVAAIGKVLGVETKVATFETNEAQTVGQISIQAGKDAPLAMQFNGNPTVASVAHRIAMDYFKLRYRQAMDSE